QGVQGISNLITLPGLINVDFADVRAIMTNAGSALMGIGTGVGENRAATAARTAIGSALLEVSIEGAKGVLFSITGGSDMTMSEVDEAAKMIASAVDPDANIIFGASIDETLVDQIRITVIATGFDEAKKRLRELTGRTIYGTMQESALHQGGTHQGGFRSQNSQSVIQQTVQPISPSDEVPPEEDEFDIPAFLRQKH
ncbi:MAG: cell division protein FtsZ, partial [Patescibacteria group bacterium]